MVRPTLRGATLVVPWSVGSPQSQEPCVIANRRNLLRRMTFVIDDRLPSIIIVISWITLLDVAGVNAPLPEVCGKMARER